MERGRGLGGVEGGISYGLPSARCSNGGDYRYRLVALGYRSFECSGPDRRF